MKQYLWLFLFLLALKAQAQDSAAAYKVGLMLPLQCTSLLENINDYLYAADKYTAGRVRLNEDATASMDFYQGMLQALQENNDSIKIDLFVYDCWNSDSVTQEILKQPQVKSLDIIIGPLSAPNAKIVAEFCKDNAILNIQPFTPSKSLTTDNPYHLKLAPTIDAHVDNMFLSIIDSFPGSNVVIYSPNNEISLSTAARFDSLFNDYNKTATQKISELVLTSKNMMAGGKKTTVTAQLVPAKRNILVLTSFDESFTNEALRQLHGAGDKYDVVVYGMPNWLGTEVLRLDYVNDFKSRISNTFYPDTSRAGVNDFITGYTKRYNTTPAEKAFLGYDVGGFLMRSLAAYGKNFPAEISTQRYTGTGFKFDIVKIMKDSTAINYYENRNVNVFSISDYQVKKVW